MLVECSHLNSDFSCFLFFMKNLPILVFTFKLINVQTSFGQLLSLDDDCFYLVELINEEIIKRIHL